MDPNINQISTCKDLKASSVEIHTGDLCDNKKNKKYEYEKLKRSAIFAKKNNLECHAGHGISYKTVEKIETRIEDMMHNKVNIEFVTKQLEKALSDIENLKDKVRANRNGAH